MLGALLNVAVIKYRFGRLKRGCKEGNEVSFPCSPVQFASQLTARIGALVESTARVKHFETPGMRVY